jgi:hypothetical protein
MEKPFNVNNWGQPLTEDKFEKRIDRLISALVRLTHSNGALAT